MSGQACRELNLHHLAAVLCRSGELKEEYDTLKREKAQSEEKLKYAQQKKKSFTAEKKQYKEQKEEAERFAKLQEEKARIESEHILWRCFYNERGTSLASLLVRRPLT